MRDRFDEKFSHRGSYPDSFCLNSEDPEPIKQFIEQEINTAIAQERKETVEMVEKLERDYCETYCEEQIIDRGYNLAINDIITSLEKKDAL